MLYMFLAVSVMLFGGVNYYIGRRGLQWLRAFSPRIAGPAYWIPFWLLALAFPVTRIFADALPLPVAEWITRIGAYWLALFVYVLPLLVAVDVLRGLNHFLRLVPPGQGRRVVRLTGGAICLLFVGLMLYGSWNARTPVVTECALAIPKSAGRHEQLHVVLLSDTHLGLINGNGRIREMVAMVNDLEPDLILIAGDIIDDDFRPFRAHQMAAELRPMRSRLGTYAILGNHDTGYETLAQFRAELEQAGILLLVDEWVKVDGSLYVVGRADSRRDGSGRPLPEIMAGVEPSLPILLMDHRPDRLEETAAAGVDLQVSGHTHRGQLWPGSLITSQAFEVDWGYLQKGATQYVVSLGYGTWGPPVRIGNRPEVVSIQITFTE